jgi:hypothetical protein
MRGMVSSKSRHYCGATPHEHRRIDGCRFNGIGESVRGNLEMSGSRDRTRTCTCSPTSLWAFTSAFHNSAWCRGPTEAAPKCSMAGTPKHMRGEARQTMLGLGGLGIRNSTITPSPESHCKRDAQLKRRCEHMQGSRGLKPAFSMPLFFAPTQPSRTHAHSHGHVHPTPFDSTFLIHTGTFRCSCHRSCAGRLGLYPC